MFCITLTWKKCNSDLALNSFYTIFNNFPINLLHIKKDSEWNTVLITGSSQTCPKLLLSEVQLGIKPKIPIIRLAEFQAQNNRLWLIKKSQIRLTFLLTCRYLWKMFFEFWKTVRTTKNNSTDLFLPKVCEAFNHHLISSGKIFNKQFTTTTLTDGFPSAASLPTISHSVGLI